jgi:hypothetical protein
MRPFAGPPMATAADAELQHLRERIYNTRWARHRDQVLVMLAVVVVLALAAAAVATGSVAFAGLALSGPAGAAAHWAFGRITIAKPHDGAEP